MDREIKVALVGNPNSGKTSIYNALTGDHQHVGNYAGVTVAKKERVIKHKDFKITIIDLPGTYSLTAHTLDEQITRNYLIDEKPDIVVDVVDYSNLERNLYLTVQLIELNIPLVLAFNMSDMAKTQGADYDLKRLEMRLAAPIVQTVGHKQQGVKEILDAVLDVFSKKISYARPDIRYGRDIEKEIESLVQHLVNSNIHLDNCDPRWLAVKCLENDTEVMEKLNLDENDPVISKISTKLKSLYGDAPEIAIAEKRYGFISGICKRSARLTVESRLTTSDKIDLVLTNRLFGLPIFMVLMYLVFHLTFTLGETPMMWIEVFFGWLGGALSGLWPAGSESALKSLIVDGIIGGVGGVIVFLPNIMFLFLGISLLEDSGYMPRAAFIMDRVMQKLGLQGKSFIPMLIGFGCSVPAIMATRTIENKRDRLVTLLVIPLMSCGARFPIYALIIPAFFPESAQGSILFAIYLIGILMAILLAKLLRISLLKGPTLPLIMELPPYRLPTWKLILTHMWEKSWLYLHKAGTVILGISIILWFLTSYPKKAEIVAVTPEAAQAEELAYSFAGRIGGAIEPAIKPMGFDWRLGTAMIGAFAAKEVFVAQLGIIFSVGEVDEESGALRSQLRKNYSALTGFVIMLFMLLSTPCMATIAATKQESGKWKWALLQLGGLTLIAYIICVAVYQTGMLIQMII